MTNPAIKHKTLSDREERKDVDVIIVGGGMVGLLLANALSQLPVSIAIVETSEHEPQWKRDRFDMRVSAITRASQCILDNVGAWQAIQNMRASPFREMRVWDASGDGRIHFDSAEIGQDCLGHIVENSAIQLALYQHAAQQNSIHWYQPAAPHKLEFNNDRVCLTLDNGSMLSAKLIVGADGSRSWVRQQAGISVRTTDYRQTAVVATVKTRQPHLETAWQRFLPTGPLAFLPLTDDYSSIVWSTTPEQADTLVAMDDDTFKLTLAENFGHRLGDIVETGPRAAFPLRSQHAGRYVGDRLALAGDAAHTIHPLAGQGVNLGFADAATLTEVLGDSLQAGKDIGSLTALRRYERWRKGENLAMLTAMTGFKTLFSSDNAILKGMRNLGLNVTNNIHPIKNTIVRHAMGLTGDLAKLARCEASR